MAKIINDKNLEKIRQKEIVIAGGCFDVLHPAHIEFLRNAKSQGKKLCILLESDENIKKLKGENRPLNNQIVRANNLSKLDFVDFIVTLSTPESNDYYYNLVKSIEPAIIAVTKGDPFLKDKMAQALMVGGKVVEVMERDPSHSTTKLIEEK